MNLRMVAAIVLSLVAVRAIASEIALLPDDAFTWTFKPYGGEKAFPVDIKSDIARQIPRTTQCCSGIYEGRGNGKSLRDLSTAGIPARPSLFIPITYGLEKIVVDHATVFNAADKFSSMGPVILLSEESYSNPNLDLEITASSPNGFINTFSSFSIRTGEYEGLIAARDDLIAFQKYLPLFESILLLAIAIILVLIRFSTGIRNLHFSYYLQALIAWAAFYLSLSGIIRDHYPTFGGYAHLAFRNLAGISVIRIVLLMCETDSRIIRRLTVFHLALTAITTAISVATFDVRFQAAAYIVDLSLFMLAFIKLTYWTLTNPKRDPVYLAITIASAAYAIGTLIDAYKLLGFYHFGFRSQLPYLNRFTSLPLLLTSIVYLASEAAAKFRIEAESKKIEELKNQVLHDLRSPVTAIRNMVLLRGDNRTLPSEEETHVLSGACDRIVEMCDSLKIGFKNTEALEKFDALTGIIEVVAEKEKELLNFKIKVIADTTIEYAVYVNAYIFKRTLSNLINNAYQARASSSTMEITAKKDSRSVTIEIIDHGKGMDGKQIHNLNLDSAFNTHRELRGLGVSSAKLHIKNWGGSFLISSNSIRGTTVAISLPTAKNSNL